MKCSQASGWAAGCSPEISHIPVAQGVSHSESSTLRGALASRGGTGGVIDCGTAEEDDPVTWETPVRPCGKIPGHGDPEILSDAPSAASGPAAGPVVSTDMAHRTSIRPMR